MTKEKVIDILKGIKDGTAWLMPNMPEDGEKAIDIAIKVVEHPEPHWIPVTEPPKGDFMPYYATCRSKVDDRENWVIEGMYTKYSGWEYPPMVRDDRAEIIAWMPKELPEPYKGVTT